MATITSIISTTRASILITQPTISGHIGSVVLSINYIPPAAGGATIFDGLARDCAALKLPTYITDHLTLI
jgi:hypothetical protein